MREQPTSFAKFVNNQDLNVEEISIEEFVKMGKENIIFRNDFAFLNLYLDIQKLDNALNLNTPLKNIFPDSQRLEKWTEFRNLTDLNIPDLEWQDRKGCIYLTILGLGAVFGIYSLFSNKDLSFFTLLHPEILVLGFITLIMLIVGIDYFVKKLKPNNKIPYSVNSDEIGGFIGRVLTYNRHKIKDEFEELYSDKFRELKDEYNKS
ncbi:MAG TPA: hypothetical protein DEF18_06140 [Muricauda sp.]|nr:hypothetical protein [uncultured Allomuricauda sp.]HBU77665.1 hypothetical protein [Allomuricauda sp.]|tara:strand:- start:3004 stop:3621 length:618 start_codon:yes stop_codon:yes gene_type:complete